MFCDEYFLLRRQNRRDLRALADGDREVLRGIARRLDDATWNSYEAQRVLRDLIDLAARAGQEGRPLTEALGKDPAGTVDELCAAIDPGTPLDRLLTWWPAAGAASGAFLAGGGGAAAVLAAVGHGGGLCGVQPLAAGVGAVPAAVQPAAGKRQPFAAPAGRAGRAAGACPGRRRSLAGAPR